MTEPTAWHNRSTFHLMRRVLQAHHALWRERLPSLTPVQFAVLLSIARLPGADQQTVARASAVETTTLANLVVRLEARGLLRRRPGTSDARRRCLELTDQGHALLAEALPVVEQVRDESLAALDPDQREALRGILTSLLEPDHETGEIDVPTATDHRPLTDEDDEGVHTP